jgi:hypothetical protein
VLAPSRLNAHVSTHPLPRGGTDLIACKLAYSL